MITNLMLTSGSDAGTDLLADLNRLLRDGLAAVEWAEDDPMPRFSITPRGRQAIGAPEARWIVGQIQALDALTQDLQDPSVWRIAGIAP